MSDTVLVEKANRVATVTLNRPEALNALDFAMMEVLAASIYATSRNLLLIAIVESAWFGWTIAVTNPIKFMF